MPKRTDLKRVLIIGSGPIVIGQACEFDYSGTQACKALRAEGLEVILVNSNPATILTDDLHAAGVLEKHGVKLIGASINAIKVAEDRQLFKDAMREIGLDVPQSGVIKTVEQGRALVRDFGKQGIKFPFIIRPSFTMGGVGGGIAYNIAELGDLVEHGVEASPVHEVLIEESVIGWKDF